MVQWYVCASYVCSPCEWVVWFYVETFTWTGTGANIVPHCSGSGRQLELWQWHWFQSKVQLKIAPWWECFNSQTQSLLAFGNNIKISHLKLRNCRCWQNARSQKGPEPEQFQKRTRMHSSWMHTARLLTVSQHALWLWGKGGTCPQGVPAQVPPCEQNDWQTGVKTAFANFVCER